MTASGDAAVARADYKFGSRVASTRSFSTLGGVYRGHGITKAAVEVGPNVRVRYSQLEEDLLAEWPRPSHLLVLSERDYAQFSEDLNRPPRVLPGLAQAAQRFPVQPDE